MVSVLGNVSESENHHSGGFTWVMLDQWKQTFDALFPDDFSIEIEVCNDSCKWTNYDALIVNEGPHFKNGVWNLFGGMNQVLKDKLSDLNSFPGKVYCYKNNGMFVPDYQDLCDKRGMDFDFKKEIKDIQFPIKSRILELGDSHVLSIHRPGNCIVKVDGKTLYGILNPKEGVKMLEEASKFYDEMVIYFGNIDVRHHLMRQEDPVASTKSLMSQYKGVLESLNCKVTLVHLLPIEDESRKLPKTGYYKGSPFTGSREEREDIRQLFNRCLNTIARINDYEVLTWEELELDENDALSFNCMESRQSVHLRPKFYKFK